MTDAGGPPPVRVCVTGTGGYLGARVAEELERRAVAVVRMSRAAGYSLEDPPGPEFFASSGAEALVHCAHDFSPRRWEDVRRLNVEGSVRTFESARRGGVRRIVFVSSLAAFRGCVSLYGRAKLEVEDHVAGAGGASVRPGTIWGSRPGGLMGSLTASVRKAGAVMPVASHRAPLFLAHEDDVARLTADLALGAVEGPATPWFAAAPQPWLLPDIVRAIAARESRRVRVVGIPWRCAWLALRTVEATGMKPAFRSDSLLSLGNASPAAERESLLRPPFPFRPFA